MIVPLSESREPELLGAVRSRLEGSKHNHYVQEVLKRLGNCKTYMWGGAVRDPIVKKRYGMPLEEKDDFDLLFDDSDGSVEFRKLLRGMGDLYYTRLGSPKLKPEEGVEISVTPFSNAARLRNGQKLPICLETALWSCDFNTGSIAYGLHDDTIYSGLAFEGIDGKEIDLLYPHGEEPHILMCRLILQSRRLGFRMGDDAIRFIVEGYGPEMDSHMRMYMKYKEIDRDIQDYVIGRVGQIQSQGVYFNPADKFLV